MIRHVNGTGVFVVVLHLSSRAESILLLCYKLFDLLRRNGLGMVQFAVFVWHEILLKELCMILLVSGRALSARRRD